MRVPADDVAAMTNPPTARPEMTPPPKAPDQIAMMKIATWCTYPATQKRNLRQDLLPHTLPGYRQGDARQKLSILCKPFTACSQDHSYCPGMQKS